jgi:hypothetical protein
VFVLVCNKCCELEGPDVGVLGGAKRDVKGGIDVDLETFCHGLKICARRLWSLWPHFQDDPLHTSDKRGSFAHVWEWSPCSLARLAARVSAFEFRDQLSRQVGINGLLDALAICNLQRDKSVVGYCG